MQQPENPNTKPTTNPVTVTLLAAILLALVALVVVIAMQGNGDSATQGTADAEDASDRPPRLEVGESVGREEVKQRGGNPAEPSALVDTARVVQTYEPAKTYRSLLQVTVEARGELHKWGITSNSYTQYVGEAEIHRTIESNDGETIVLTQEFKRARSVSAWSRLTALRIDLPGGVQTVLDLAGTAVAAYYGQMLPTGWSELGIATANKIFENELVLQAINRLEDDPTAEIFVFVDDLEGVKVRLTYVNGVGVTELESLRGSLSHDAQDMIMATAVLSDAYILPDLESEPGDTWTIHGQDMLPILDPSMRSTMTGSLTARRGEDGGSAQRPTAEIILGRGVLNLHASDGSRRSQARWAPRGRMTFDFSDGIVTHAELGGDFQIEERSTNHLLFETRWSVEPEYRVVYHNEVLE